MLSISPIRRGAGGYYLKLGREDDYYTKGAETLGRWQGRGLEALGLKPGDPVTPEALRNLMRGFSPDGQTPLCQNAGRDNHRPGYDLTFSYVKHGSTAWSQADPSRRVQIAACHGVPVDAALRFLEREAAFTRVGRGGARQEPVEGLVVACFDHKWSRAGDPQLHSHCLVMNVAPRADGSWGTIESKHLLEHKMAAGAVYRAECARLLQDLGFRVEREGSFFKLPDVPEALVERFSSRRRQIEERLGAESASARASERATLLTRPAKKAVPQEVLIAKALEEGRRAGFDVETIIRPPKALDIERERTEATRAALSSLMKSQSYFTRLQFLRRLAEQAPGRGLGAGEVLAACDDFLSTSKSVVPLGLRRGKPFFSTPELLETERRMIDQVRASREDRASAVSEETLAAACKQVERDRNLRLSEEQVRAVRHVTMNPGGIQVIQGIAGSGKTAALDAVRRAFESDGYKVIGTAVSGKAAEELKQGSGIESCTLRRLLLMTSERTFFQAWVEAQKAALRNILHGGFHSTSAFLKYIEKAKQPTFTLPDSGAEKTMLEAYAAAQKEARQRGGFASTRAFLKYMEEGRTPAEELDSRTVVVLDEAAMVNTRDMAQLVDVARKAGTRLVLVGDARQLSPIKQGGAFPRIRDEVGHADLSEIHRQREAWAREAVRRMAEGEALAALRAYAERGLLAVAEGRDEARSQLIADWAKRGVDRPQDNLILTTTRHDAAVLNGMAQQERLERGAISYSDSVQAGPHRIYEGDRVIFTKNSLALGVSNGQLGTVETVDAKGERLSVRLDNERLAAVRLREYDRLQLSYCLTTAKAQGSTVENAYLLIGGPNQDQALSYVQISRARAETRLYVDRLQAGEELADLARQMSKTNAKELAIDQVDRNENDSQIRSQEIER